MARAAEAQERVADQWGGAQAMPSARFARRLGLMAEVGWSMMFHQRLKLVGTLVGVLFAVLLSNFAVGTFLSLLAKGTMLQQRANADIWIVPKGAELLGQGMLDLHALSAARATRGVAESAPALMGGAEVVVPGGRREAVMLIGAAAPYTLGGPWNVVAGDVQSLRHPDTLIFESSIRESFGGLNVGSVREVGGRRTVVGAFTYGLAPFGAAYAFADYETAREYLHAPRDRASFVLVRLDGSRPAEEVAAELRSRVSGADVHVTQAFIHIVYRQILTKTPIGITFGAITFFGFLVGMIVVGLSMFSAVVDNIREFGTLKAVGCTTFDLALLLLTQSVVFGVVGSVAGLAVVGLIALGMRSPNMGLELPWQLPVATVLLMVGMCASASYFALMRIRKLEPAMVFR